MTGFLSNLKKFIKDHNLISKGDNILIGFSGGADSTALLYSLIRMRDELELNLIAAHINYNLRGNDSLADMQFVRDFCSKNDIPLYVKEVNLLGCKDLENKARQVRFTFFETLKNQYKIDKIALGHNKDDAAETVLLHLFRGCGITGMKGILPQNGDIIRPLLCFYRFEITDFLKSSSIISWCEDKSNEENIYSRNKIRNIVIPTIKEQINPNITQTLYDNSLIFNLTDSYLREQCLKIMEEAVVVESEQEIQLNLSVVKEQNLIITYYLLRNVMAQLIKSENNFSQAHFTEIVSIFNSKGSKLITLPNGVTIQKEYNLLKVSISSSDTPGIDISDRYRLKCEIISRSEMKSIGMDNEHIAVVDYDKLKLPLNISKRKNGDRFSPFGMAGSKKVKDFLIDEKISKFDRDKIIIVRDREKIIWLVGYRLDDRVKVEEGSKRIAKLELIENE